MIISCQFLNKNDIDFNSSIKIFFLIEMKFNEFDKHATEEKLSSVEKL